MKILIVAYWHDPRFKKKTGGLIRMFELANNLTREGNETTLILPKLGNPGKQTIARVIEVPFIDFPILRPLSFHFLSCLFLMITLKRDVAFVYVRKMNSFLQLLICKLYGIKTYFEVPNDPYLGYRLSGKMKRILEEWTDRLSMHLADRIVVLSEWSKQRLVLLGGIHLSKILVLPSGTDTDLYQPLGKKQCCESIGLDPALYYVGFAGTFFEFQGLDILVDAAPEIIDKFPETRFLLVGDGPARGDLEKQVFSKHVENSFIFTGQVSYLVVPTYLGAMDICVAPHHENTNQASPVKLFDYMACAKPIVASRLDVVSEIVQESGGALLVEAGNPQALTNAVIRLLGNSAERLAMGNLGRAYVLLNYDRKQINRRLVSDYLNLVNIKKRKS